MKVMARPAGGNIETGSGTLIGTRTETGFTTASVYDVVPGDFMER